MLWVGVMCRGNGCHVQGVGVGAEWVGVDMVMVGVMCGRGGEGVDVFWVGVMGGGVGACGHAEGGCERDKPASVQL